MALERRPYAWDWVLAGAHAIPWTNSSTFFETTVSGLLDGHQGTCIECCGAVRRQ